MSWDQETSKGRLAAEWKRLESTEFVIKKLTREMDLSNLGLNEGRLVHGTHIYNDIANFSELLDSPLLRRDDSKRLHRLLHVIRTEQRRIVQFVFGGDKIQIQGSKFHGLLYKPYDDDGELAWSSVLAGVALYLLLTRAVPVVFEGYPTPTSTIGLDLGDSLVANIGVRGDRELISVGRPANHAAKILGSPNAIVVTPELYNCLREEEQLHFVEDPDQNVFTLNFASLGDPQEVIQDAGFEWTIEDSIDYMTTSLKALPLEDIVIEEARERIDSVSLGPKRAKSCDGGSIFVDLDGFTALVDKLLQTEDLTKLSRAVKWLHLFRYELGQMTECDFDGITIQHQGDRLLALFHTPTGNDGRVARKVVDAAISYNSSVEEVLNKHHAIFGPLHVAIGCAFGKTLVSRSGVRGDLDLTCLGRATQRAEEIQLTLKGNEMGITPDIFEAINVDAIRDAFTFDNSNDFHIARALTWASVENRERENQYKVSSRAAYTPARTIAIGAAVGEGARALKVTRPWSE